MGADLPSGSGNGKYDPRKAPSRTDVNQRQLRPVSAACMLIQHRQEGKAVVNVPLHCLTPVPDRCAQTQKGS